MNSRFDEITKGLLSLAVILMFTVALIAGQARANLPAEVSRTPEFSLTTELNIILDAETLQKIEALPHVVDAILALPVEIDVTFRGGKSSAAGSDHSLLQ